MTSTNLNHAAPLRRPPTEPMTLVPAIAGDPHAVNEVLRWIRPIVMRYCRTHVGSGEKAVASADDVAQEVCLAVFTALPSYRHQGRPFLAFVYGIAAHKIADARRTAARNRTDPVAQVPDTPETTDGPEAQLIQAESARRMATLLETLPDKQRDILRLRVVAGLSAQETAQAVGSTPGTVLVAQHRTLRHLRAMLATQKTISSPHTDADRIVKPAEQTPPIDEKTRIFSKRPRLQRQPTGAIRSADS